MPLSTANESHLQEILKLREQESGLNADLRELHSELRAEIRKTDSLQQQVRSLEQQNLSLKDEAAKAQEQLTVLNQKLSDQVIEIDRLTSRQSASPQSGARNADLSEEDKRRLLFYEADAVSIMKSKDTSKSKKSALGQMVAVDFLVDEAGEFLVETERGKLLLQDIHRAVTRQAAKLESLPDVSSEPSTPKRLLRWYDDHYHSELMDAVENLENAHVEVSRALGSWKALKLLQICLRGKEKRKRKAEKPVPAKKSKKSTKSNTCSADPPAASGLGDSSMPTDSDSAPEEDTLAEETTVFDYSAMERKQRELVKGWLKIFPPEFATLHKSCMNPKLQGDLGKLEGFRTLVSALQACDQAPASIFGGTPAPELDQWLKGLTDELNIWRPSFQNSGPSYGHDALGTWPGHERLDTLRFPSNFGTKVQAARCFSVLILTYLVGEWQNKEMFKFDNGENSNATVGWVVAGFHLNNFSSMIWNSVPELVNNLRPQLPAKVSKSARKRGSQPAQSVEEPSNNTTEQGSQPPPSPEEEPPRPSKKRATRATRQ